MTGRYIALRLAVDDGVATVTLDRPERRNALDLAMCHDLVAVMRALASDDDVRVVLVAAAGPVFCAGADLKERQGMSAEQATARRVAAFTAYASIESLPQPVIAVVQGPAVGSGGEIAAACDFVVASTAASFRWPEVSWGTVGATQRLPRIVGPRKAKELLWTGRSVDAAEAQSLGLVNVVCEPETLVATATAIARTIAAAPPLAVRLAKRCIDEGLEATREGAMGIELLAIEENLRGSDWQQRIARFGRGGDDGGG
jgi:enoyl-CoA hydratase